MARPYRAGAGLLVLGLTTVFALPPSLRGQPPAPPPAGGPVRLPSDTRVRQKLEAAREYANAGQWGEAVRVLQDLLDAREDLFLPNNEPSDRPAACSRGIRAEAGRLLASLPPKGLEVYNALHGAKARALLKEALEKDDRQLLAQVAQRYLCTDAGAEAAERLGTYYLDRGNHDLAGRCFAHLLSRPDLGRLSPLTLYRAAVAFRQTGDKAGEERAWKQLAARAPDGLTLGGRAYEVDRLRADLARLTAGPPGGDGDVPFLEPVWKVSTVLSGQGPDWIDAGLKAQEQAHRPALPGYYPIALPGRVVYRSHGGVHALDPASGRELWKAPSVLGLDGIAANSGKAAVVRSWLQNMYGDAAHFPIESSMLGRLSSDGERAYAVEELAFPPPPEVVLSLQPGVPVPLWLRETAPANRLRALDLDTGAVVWEKGARGEWQNSFFLGAPLPVGGRLYALVERDGEIRLACLDPASGAVIWQQRLGTTADRMALDPGRRLRGVPMTYAGGLLLCPTDAGAVFAFDLFAHALAWAYLYPSKKKPNETGTGFNLGDFNNSWRESAPAVAGDRVVLTPADSDEVHCVGLRDGRPLWQARRDGDNYLAGAFGERALLVGPGRARALALKDGREAWARPVGFVSGRGAGGGNVYYLPLKASEETGGPGVLALDPAAGKVLAFSPSRNGDVPGNLTFWRGQVLSQTATTLTAYPQLKERMKRINELLAGDPHDPRGLGERGTLRLDQGDVAGALADLRAAVAASPAGAAKRDARDRLRAALRQAVQRDLAGADKYLAEFEASGRVPIPDGATAGERALFDAERRRREADYLLVLARVREGQGRAAEALEARLAYAEHLADQPGARFLEVELHLLALQRHREAPQVAARALEALARLLTEKGQVEDALYYYRQLAEDFGPAPVRDGQTGADFLKGLALDKRFLPLLDDPWAGHKYRTTEARGLFPPRGGLVALEPEGEAPPCLRRLRLVFDTTGGGALRLLDRNSGAELWNHGVAVGNLRPVLRTAPPQTWIPYRAEGHLAVVSLGHMAYGIDLLGRRLLWAKDLGERPAPWPQQVIVDDDRGRLKVQYQDGVIQPLGRMAPIRPAGVGLAVRGRLVALDPLSGETLWARQLSGQPSELVADDAQICLEVQPRPGEFLQAVSRHLLVLPPPPLTAGSALVPPGRNDRLLALYDPLTGKDVWGVPLAPGALVARSEVPHLTATVGRDGKVRVYDLRRRAELFRAEVDADHLRGAAEVRLFQDRWHFYLLLNRELRARDGLAGPALPNTVGGLRTLPAHGALYAFHRGSGSPHWVSAVKAQHLLLERLDESPLLLFSAVVQRADPRSPGPVFTVTSIDKHTGKMVWPAKDYAPITSPVHAVQINPAAGTIDLISRHWKMRHTVAD